MTEWVNQVLIGEHTGILVLLAVFSLGLASTFTSCCNPAILAGLAGYSGDGAQEARRAVDKKRMEGNARDERRQYVVVPAMPVIDPGRRP